MNSVSTALTPIRALHKPQQENYTLKLPRTHTFTAYVLASLLRGEHISHWSVLEKINNYRLAVPIDTLRQAHYPIEDVWCKSKAGKKYKKYFITPDNIQLIRLQLGDRLASFLEVTSNG